jgi:hypothetical protein
MTTRFTPALYVALTCSAFPALAQDAVGIGPPPPLPEVATIEPAPLPEPDGAVGWEGEWHGDWAPDGTYRGTWTGTYSEPSGVASAPLIRRVIPASPFSFEQRSAWLAQCRSVYLQSGASLGGGNGSPDACETQLAQYESSYAAPPYGAPYAYGQGAYGYPSAPVIWVRVPIVRERATPAEALEVDEE